ncbi:MAG: hypothetical protein R3E01_22450 [Pirellulaceae bacterium]
MFDVLSLAWWDFRWYGFDLVWVDSEFRESLPTSLLMGIGRQGVAASVIDLAVDFVSVALVATARWESDGVEEDVDCPSDLFHR